MKTLGNMCSFVNHQSKECSFLFCSFQVLHCPVKLLSHQQRIPLQYLLQSIWGGKPSAPGNQLWQCGRSGGICGASHLWVSPPDVQGKDSGKGGPTEIGQQQVCCIWGHLVELKDSGCQHSHQSCIATLKCEQLQVTIIMPN